MSHSSRTPLSAWSPSWDLGPGCSLSEGLCVRILGTLPQAQGAGDPAVLTCDAVSGSPGSVMVLASQTLAAKASCVW